MTKPRRLPLRVRLVAGFIAIMVVLLTAAGAIVFWRVEVALDRTINSELNDERLAVLLHREDPSAVSVLSDLSPGDIGQVLSKSGEVLARTHAAAATAIVPPGPDVVPGRRLTLYGSLFGGTGNRLRAAVVPLDGHDQRYAVVAVRLGRRDEALRELLAQLLIANGAALLVSSAVGYFLARSSLAPVERYRAKAEQIIEGDTDLRLEVPAGAQDEVTRLGDTLNRLLASQQAAAIAQRQFLSDASHELRTPLSALKAEVDLALRRKRTNEEYQQTLSELAGDIERLIELAEQLLVLEQAAASQSAFCEADLSAVICSAVTRTRAEIGSGASHPSKDAVLVDGVVAPLRVGISELQLAQILDNLLTNARVHGAQPIEVRTDRPGSAVRLTVHDHGPGVSGEFLPVAVERFRRVDGARQTPGSGLGLALVHALVSTHDAELRLCSNGVHHRFAPLRFDAPCDHPSEGTTASVLMAAITTS